MITMKTIAQACGVARSTVSYALNDRYIKGINIPPETRKHIKQVAQDMGYCCNELAKTIITRKSNVLGFYADSLEQEYISRTLSGVFEAAQSNGYFVKLFSPEKTAQETIKKIIGQRPAGIIAWSPSPGLIDGLKNSTKTYSIPTVFVGSFHPVKWASGVTSNDAVGSKLAVDYLISKGHVDIMHLAGPQSRGYAAERLKGFRQAMKEAGLRCTAKNIAESAEERYLDERQQEAYLTNTLEEICNRKKRPTALYCVSDFYAMQAIRILSKLGLCVPGDVSIVGYGNLTMAKYASPGLTTIAQPFEQIGNEAFSAILKSIESAELRNGTLMLDVQLIERDSVANLNRQT